jgi:hypothetical protein
LAPAAIGGQPRVWTGVGAANEASNQRLTGSENGARVDSGVSIRRVANRPILRIGPVRWQAVDLPALGAAVLYHGSSSAISERRGALRSRSESRGSESGQSTAMSGSSQAIPASVAWS